MSKTKRMIRAFIIFDLMMICLYLLLNAYQPMLFEILRHGLSEIDDYRIFHNREIRKATVVSSFPQMLIDLSNSMVSIDNDEKVALEEFVNESETTALVIVKDGRLAFEGYFNGFNRADLSMAFSVTKSVVSMLVGLALDDGLISSVDDPIMDYLPQLDQARFSEIRIRHLLQMTSGIEYNESNFNPFSIHAEAYYTPDLAALVQRFKINASPGVEFNYKSGDTILLGLILSKVLNGETISAYLQRKIWGPLDMEYNALWAVDRPGGLEKVWCCLSARAIDFARLGQLYLDKGRWKGRQIVPAWWIEKSTKRDVSEGSAPFYQHGWYIMSETYGDFRAEGVRGQFIYVNPAHNTVVVRLGKSLGGYDWDEWKNILTGLSQIVSGGENGGLL